MAATAMEFSNLWDIVYSLRRVFIHRFHVVNAKAGVNIPMRSKTAPGKMSVTALRQPRPSNPPLW